MSYNAYNVSYDSPRFCEREGACLRAVNMLQNYAKGRGHASVPHTGNAGREGDPAKPVPVLVEPSKDKANTHPSKSANNKNNIHST